jgi:hypothetical protein
MVEYLHDAIRATAGQEITISAKITDDNEAIIKDSCGLMLYDGEDMLVMVNGFYYEDTEQIQFTIPAEVTKGLKGRYWYCFCQNGKSLCFKQPIYLK